MTVTDTLAPSHLLASESIAGCAAEQAAKRKESKYSGLPSTYAFIPIALETLGPDNQPSMEFLDMLGSKIFSFTGDIREKAYLWQRLSIQRFNAVCFRGTFKQMV